MRAVARVDSYILQFIDATRVGMFYSESRLRQYSPIAGKMSENSVGYWVIGRWWKSLTETIGSNPAYPMQRMLLRTKVRSRGVVIRNLAILVINVAERY